MTTSTAPVPVVPPGADTRTVDGTRPASATAEAARLAKDGNSANQSVALPKGQIIPLFIGLMLAMLLAALNQTVLSSAMPTILGEFHAVEHMSWAVTAYILASTVVMPIYGNLSDTLGRRPLLVSAILLFMAGSVVGALATDITGLIASRAIQGLGGGGLMILAQAAIADVVPARERGKYMGAMGGVFALASVAGPLLGGWLTEGPGWRWAFWMNMPVGVLALTAAILFLRLPRRRLQTRVDGVGMALLAVATSALVMFATFGGHQFEWVSSTSAWLVGLALVAGLAFLFVESRAAQPIMPLALFRDRNFNLTTIASLAIGVAMFGVLGYMPLYLQMVTGDGPTISGLLMIPMMGSLLITSVISGRIVSATGRYKLLPIVGTVIVAGALGLMSTISTDTPVWVVCAFLAVLGCGLGLSMQILTLIVQNSFPIRMVGTATASTNYFRQVGATLGSALVGSIFTQRLTDNFEHALPPQVRAHSGGTGSLSPAAVNGLPEPIRSLILTAFNDALVPIFLWLVPLVLVATVVLLFVREVPLATAVARETRAEALAEGQLTVTDPALDRDAVGATFEPAPHGRHAERGHTRR